MCAMRLSLQPAMMYFMQTSSGFAGLLLFMLDYCMCFVSSLFCFMCVLFITFVLRRPLRDPNGDGRGGREQNSGSGAHAEGRGSAAAAAKSLLSLSSNNNNDNNNNNMFTIIISSSSSSSNNTNDSNSSSSSSSSSSIIIIIIIIIIVIIIRGERNRRTSDLPRPRAHPACLRELWGSQGRGFEHHRSTRGFEHVKS